LPGAAEVSRVFWGGPELAVWLDTAYAARARRPRGALEDFDADTLR
jgi:hypothetical protein